LARGGELTLGHRDGPVIVVRGGTDDGSLAAAAKAAGTSSMTWGRGAGDGAEGLRSSLRGQGSGFEIGVVGGRAGGRTLVEELRLVEAEKARPENQAELAGIFGAVLAAERGLAAGLEKVRGASALFAHMAGAGDRPGSSAWTDDELEANTASWLERLSEERVLCQPEAGALDRARFWIRMGQRLWDQEVRRRLSCVYFEERTRRLLMMVAGAWMELRPQGWVVLGGTGFRLEGAAKRHAWPQVMEWEGGRIGRNALGYLTGYQRAYRFDGLMERVVGGDRGGAGGGVRDQLAARVSRELLEEAALRWACDPFGSFRVDVPRMTPMHGWGVSSMRVWLIPRKGMWVALEKGEEPAASFQWMAAAPHMRRWVVSEGMLPAIHLTLSALWRDLKIGGREVILSEERQGATGEERGRWKGVRLFGRIRWGSEAELGRILREAYPVGQHVRVLPAGKQASRRAFRRALAQGVILRPGTTYVRGHERGKPDDDLSAVPVKAQGLARLIMASRGMAEGG